MYDVMDESIIAERIVTIAQEHCADEQPSGAISLHLGIGESIELNIERLTQSFQFLTTETSLENADLFIERPRMIVCCNVCGATFHPTARDGACTRCASRDVATVSGDELRVREVKIGSGVERSRNT
jgi:Zn finger protein HypA/HybF involved in hydrogenase expression